MDFDFKLEKATFMVLFISKWKKLIKLAIKREISYTLPQMIEEKYNQLLKPKLERIDNYIEFLPGLGFDFTLSEKPKIENCYIEMKSNWNIVHLKNKTHGEN